MVNSFRALGIAAAISLAAMTPQAQAQSAQAASRTSQVSVPVTTLAPIVVAVEGLRFSGQAVISSRLASDPDFGRPSLVLLFDMTGVTGVGAASGLLYRALSQEYVVRPHAMNQNIGFTFPMATDPDAPLASVRTGDARFVMNVDLATGAVTSVTAALTPR